ncbi:unnamed protein product [Ceratitis capitata]|uniref:(Mediterranean fruit fly) hypothetical protein n=1 Tax=Ceratitis capitata TaxID=7213 RepID=A0A811UNW5_CERCA|nr:unnamed protein product [Ceratitis capitata]
MMYGPCGTLNPDSPCMLDENVLSGFLEHWYPVQRQGTMNIHRRSVEDGVIGDKCLVIAHKVLGQLGMPAPYRTASTSLAADLCREQNTLTDDLLLNMFYADGTGMLCQIEASFKKEILLSTSKQVSVPFA